MSWNFHDETRVGAESALDACDYFVDEVIEPWRVMGSVSRLFFLLADFFGEIGVRLSVCIGCFHDS